MSERCSHIWSEDYICTVCGAVGTFSPPMWLWFHDGIRPGARTVLLALWTFSDHNTSAPPPIFPSNKAIGKRLCGMASSTLREHLAYLKAEGWIRIVDGSGRCIELAWATPFPTESRTPPEVRKDDGIPAPTAGKPADATESRTAGKPEGGDGIPAPGPPENRRGATESRTHTYDLPNHSTYQPPDQRARARDQDGVSHAIDPPADVAARNPGELFAGIPPEAKRDHVREVFDHLVARISAAKRECGVSPASAPRTLTSARRSRIMARIRESGGGDLALGVEMCKRVIAVDEAECRAQGPGGKSWDYWTADTPFRNAENFESRLNRWRADGNHRPFGGGRQEASRHDANTGTSARHGTSDQKHRLAQMAAANDG